MNHEGTKTRRVAIIGVISTIVLVVGACIYLMNNPKFQRAFRHWRMAHLDSTVRYRLVGKYSSSLLRQGMTKDEVWEVLGWPDNHDNKYIWFWCCNATSRAKYTSWIEFSKYGDGPGAFLLFAPDGLLAYPHTFKNAQGGPWETYREQVADRWHPGTKAQSREFTKSLLGPEPYERAEDIFWTEPNDVPTTDLVPSNALESSQ